MIALLLISGACPLLILLDPSVRNQPVTALLYMTGFYGLMALIGWFTLHYGTALIPFLLLIPVLLLTVLFLKNRTKRK